MTGSLPRLARVEFYKGNGIWSFYDLDEKGETKLAGTMSGSEPKSKEDYVRRLDQNGNDWDKAMEEHMKAGMKRLNKLVEEVKKKADD